MGKPKRRAPTSKADALCALFCLGRCCDQMVSQFMCWFAVEAVGVKFALGHLRFFQRASGRSFALRAYVVRQPDRAVLRMRALTNVRCSDVSQRIRALNHSIA